MDNPLIVRLSGISIAVIIGEDKGKDGDKIEFHTQDNKKEIPIIDKFLMDFYTSHGLNQLQNTTGMRRLETISPNTSEVELSVAIEFKDKESLTLALPLIESAEKKLALNIKNALVVSQEYSERRKSKTHKQELLKTVPLEYHEETLNFLSEASFDFKFLLNDEVIPIKKPEHIAPLIRKDSLVNKDDFISLKEAIFLGYDAKNSISIRISSPDINGHYSKGDIYHISNTCEKFIPFSVDSYARAIINISLKLVDGKYLIDNYEVYEKEEDLFD